MLDLLAGLQQHFAFPHFRPGQEQAIQHILDKRDLLVVMPTGSGKSLIYQLPALLLPGTALVFSPLVSLMKDQVDSLTRRGLPATFVNSSLDVAEQGYRLHALAEGRYKIVLIAPERLRSQSFREALAQTPINLLAIDEAHCLSQWGHDFRPDYLHIADARRDFKPPLTLALTATATPRVQDDILRMLGLSDAERLITGFNRPNLTFEVFSTPSVNNKLAFLRDFLAEAEGAGIIYTGTRRDTEEVAEFIREVCGLDARPYHGALDAAVRVATQDAFMSGDLPLVVATNAFGMGIDRPDVRFVLHYSVPGALEAYYQEAGRAGRDGIPARAILLYSPKDTALHEFFIENDSPSADDLRSVYNFVRGPVKGLTFEDIERATGLPQVKARVALEQLELARALQREPDEAFGRLRLKALSLSDAELRRMAAQTAARRDHKRALLSLMVAYAETNACRRRTLLNYFGDPDSADAPLCCDNCLTRADSQTSPMASGELTSLSQSERAALIVLDTLSHLQWDIGKGKLAKLLKGSATKEMGPYLKAKYFGKFAALRLAEIESLIGQLIDTGYLKQVGSRLPTLKLSAKGELALALRAAIQVNLRPVQPAAAQRMAAQKEAGSTIALTHQLLTRGLAPEQIAAERGLTLYTIYSHLARLITDRQISIEVVVPTDVRQQVLAVINSLGTVERLSEIKIRLPDSIDYGVIRCVVNAWLLERESASQPSNPADKDRVSHIYELGESASPEAVTELIAALGDANGNVRRLAASALGKLRAAEGVGPLLALLSNVSAPQVRQYAIKALGKIRDERARTSLEQIASNSDEMEYNRFAAKAALAALTSQTPPSKLALPSDPVAAFLARPHPRPLTGPWLAGWALDFNSRFSGANHTRSEVGNLVYAYKYRGERRLARDLAARWVELLANHLELPKPDCVIPIPPSTQREFAPVTLLAQLLAEQLSIQALTDTLVKTRATKPQKEMTALAQKQANVAEAFGLKSDIRGKRVLLVDDLYDSGATLAEAARTLQRGGAASIVVLTLTKTIHADR